MATATRGIKSIEVGGRILTELISASAPMMLKDLAAATDLTPAQTHAYLTSYRNTGLVEQDPHTGLYQVGPLAIRLGAARIKHTAGLNKTRTAVERLASELGLMATMAVPGPLGPTVVYMQQAEDPLHINVRPGTLFSVVGTASGQAFAAFSEDEKIKRLIKDELNNKSGVRTMRHNSSPEQFKQLIKKIRKEQYSHVEGVPIPGVNAITAPVYDEKKSVIAVITLIGRDTDLNVQPNSPQVKRLLETCQSITE